MQLAEWQLSRWIITSAGSRRAPATKAAPKEEIEEEENNEAAPMEGVETAAEQLVKPAAKGKAVAKPAARNAAPKVCTSRDELRSESPSTGGLLGGSPWRLAERAYCM